MVDVGPTSGDSRMQVAVVLMLASTIVMLLILFLFKKYRAPPGPCGVPLFGYLLYLEKEFHLTFNSLRETYGDVFSISFGSWPTVVVSGYDTIHEGLVGKGDDFSARPAFTSLRMLNDGRDFGGGPFDDDWKTLHRVVVSALGKFMSSKTAFIEDTVHAETISMIGNFTAHKHGDSFNPKKVICRANFRMILQLFFGKAETASQDEKIAAVHAGWIDYVAYKKANPLLDLMPWVGHIARSKLNGLRDIIKQNEERRRTWIVEHESTLTANGPNRDLADCLIRESNDQSAAGLDKRRVTESLDILIQGNISTGSALQWVILLMAAYPEVQERVYKEIVEVIGKLRAPALSDRDKMNYVQATIAESLRFASPVPLAIPHSAVCDTTLKDFNIKKDTMVLFNLNSIHTDKGLWGDPGNFRPERMLTLEGLLDKGQVDKVCAFSIGRRCCTASCLARDMLFLCLATLVQRAKLTKPSDVPNYSMEGEYFPSRNPKDFQVCATTRD